LENGLLALALKHAEVRGQHKGAEIVIVKLIGEDRAKEVLLLDFEYTILALIRLRLQLYMLIKVDQLNIKYNGQLNALVDV
jgi:hypothetical protein